MIFQTKYLFLLLLATLVMNTCSTAPRHEIKSENRDPDWDVDPFNKILVIGVYDDKSFRISNESVFAAELSEKAVSASPSYELFPNLDALDDEAEIREALAGKDFDAILTIATIDAGDDYDTEGWNTQYNIFSILGSDRGAHWTQLAGQLDYYESGKFVLDIGLFDSKTLKPVWNATTESYSQEGASEQVKTIADFMIKVLKERKFI